jgi:MOSC domain-containing protein YiiM
MSESDATGRVYIQQPIHVPAYFCSLFGTRTGILLITMMEIVSVNVGIPRVIKRGDDEILTGIFKSAVQGPVTVRPLNLDGDQQADLKVHGGIYKAIYAYPAEHYPFWGSVYPELELPWGMFGENLTTVGTNESSMCIGDQVRIGTAILQVTQPRVPCFKLAAKFDDDEIIDTFFSSGRSGMYFSVVEEGQLQAGDKMELVHPDPARFSIREALRLYLKAPGRETLERALRTETLPPGLRRRAENLNAKI